MLKERQKDFLEEHGFKLNLNNEYELKFEGVDFHLIWSIPHQVGASYYEGDTALVYDFSHLVDVLEYIS